MPVVGVMEKYRALVAVVYLFVIPLLLIGAAGWQSYDSHQLKKKVERQAAEGKQAHDYLCFQKQVLIPGRIQTTLKYRADVAAGRRDPVQGITESDIDAGLRRDKGALKALSEGPSRVTCD